MGHEKLAFGVQALIFLKRGKIGPRLLWLFHA